MTVYSSIINQRAMEETRTGAPPFCARTPYGVTWEVWVSFDPSISNWRNAREIPEGFVSRPWGWYREDRQVGKSWTSFQRAKFHGILYARPVFELATERFKRKWTLSEIYYSASRLYKHLPGAILWNYPRNSRTFLFDFHDFRSNFNLFVLVRPSMLHVCYTQFSLWF